MLEKIFALLEAIPFIGRIFSFLWGVWLICKKDFRLIQNLSRPIMVIDSSGKDINLVIALIKDAGFFRLENSSNTAQNLDRIKKHSMVVVGYTKSESEISRIIDAVRAKSIPVIFFAEQGEISDEDKKKIHGYSYAEIANSSFRLMNLIFSILSTHKYSR